MRRPAPTPRTASRRGTNSRPRRTAIERQRGERLAAPAAVAAGAVARVEPRDRADVGVREAAEEPAPQRPVHDRAAGHVARADRRGRRARWRRSDRGRWRGSCERSASIWQIDVAPAGRARAGCRRRTSARGRGRSVRCITSTRPGYASASSSASCAGAVRRLVVDDQHADTSGYAISACDQHRQVVALVVSRHDDQRRARRHRQRRPSMRSDGDLLGDQSDQQDHDAQQNQQHRRVGDVRLRDDRPRRIGGAEQERARR